MQFRAIYEEAEEAIAIKNLEMPVSIDSLQWYTPDGSYIFSNSKKGPIRIRESKALGSITANYYLKLEIWDNSWLIFHSTEYWRNVIEKHRSKETGELPDPNFKSKFGNTKEEALHNAIESFKLLANYSFGSTI